MKSEFALWDMDSGNLVGRYPTPEAALSVVRRSLEDHGYESTAELGLSGVNATGKTVALANGAALVKMATSRPDRSILKSPQSPYPMRTAHYRVRKVFRWARAGVAAAVYGAGERKQRPPRHSKFI